MVRRSCYSRDVHNSELAHMLTRMFLCELSLFNCKQSEMTQIPWPKPIPFRNNKTMIIIQ
jgi:hypothetical protein